MPEGQETYVTARVLGTFGYFDPEYTSVSLGVTKIIFWLQNMFKGVQYNLIGNSCPCRINYTCIIHNYYHEGQFYRYTVHEVTYIQTKIYLVAIRQVRHMKISCLV